MCGSRAHLEDESIAQRTIIRTILMWVKITIATSDFFQLHAAIFRVGFHACVWIFAVRTVKDTQCGFKVADIQISRTCFICFDLFPNLFSAVEKKIC